MPDEGNTQSTGPSQADIAKLEKEIEKLTANLETAQSTIKALEKDKKELEGSIGGYKSANNQANKQVADLQGQLEKIQEQFEDKSGEVVNLQQQIEGLTGQVTDLSEQNNQLQGDMKLWNVIAENPDLHRHVGNIPELSKIVRPDADEETIQSVLASMTAGENQRAQNTTQQAIQNLQAGGSPPGDANKQPGGNDQAPQTVPELHQALQTMQPNDPRYNQYLMQLDQLDQNGAGEGQQQQPN